KNNLFVSNALINYWRFEVVYSSSLQNGSSTIDFEINQSPQNGSCSISPQNGTTTTLFNISCSNWQDSDGVQGYSFQSWTIDYTQQMIIAYSSVSTVQVRLPAGADNTSLLHIVVRIRDTLNCITEYNLSSVIVLADSELINSLVNDLQTSTTNLSNHPLVQVLNSGNQNAISQVINSLSQKFNQINLGSIQSIVANGIPTSNIAVSSLDSQNQPGSSTSFNASVLTEYNEQLNIYANVRDYLITFTTDLIPTNADSIALQATALAQLTQSPNQLTRTASMLGSAKCYQLASTLSSIATSVPYEDVQTAATQIAQCTTNVLTAINGPLQQRTNVLDLDFSRANTLPSDYDTDLELDWSNPNLFADGNDFSWETIEKNRNIYYQKQATNEISTEVEQTISLISSALNIHLNLGQNLTVNTSSIFMSMETISVGSLSNKSIEQIGDARIQMPSNLQFNSTDSSSLSIQSIMQPLASYGNSQSDLKTNLSRSMSLSILDQDKNEISIQTDFDNPIEIIIIRDPNFILPSMTLQNVTSYDSNPHNQLFDLYFINITSNLSISIHFEIHPLNTNLSYLFIYKFDNPPLLNSSIDQIDGWIVFCPSNLTNESIYAYFIDNQKTMSHRSLIYGEGESASWFLKYIIVRDLQTTEKFHFICQKWFAVEKGDGAIDYVLPVAGEYQKQEFSYVLSKQAYHSVSDDHLWFSIFSRPSSNKFTRVQRCTCCFVLLLTAMFLNILYYDQSNDAETNTSTRSLSLGPLYISPEQIGIGIIVEVLTFVPSLFLVQFFRRIQSRRVHQMSPLRAAMYKIKQEPIPSETTVKSSDEKKSFRLLFPWWCLFIAYGLSFIVAAISIFFIIVRGIEFGDLKTQKWLASLLSGFFSSIFLIQPIKIIFLTLLFAVFMRNTNEDEQAAEFIDDDNIELNDDEEYLHSIKAESSFIYRSQTVANRLDKVDIARARDRRLKEIQMWSIIREVFTFFVFLSLLYTITYTNVNNNAFYQVDHLQKFFLNTRQIDNDYTKISTISDYWNWLENSFVENIRAQEWYNGQPPSNLSGYINDKSNRLIGWATMRQLRIKPDSCKIAKAVQNLFAHCYDDYSFFNEEKQSFQPGWTNNQTSSSFNSAINQAFTYQTGDELNSSIYVGKHQTYNSGGYAYEFRGRLSDLQSNLSELYQLQWIDRQTRAVLIQLSLYNPNSQFFISCNLLVEFLSSGWIEPQSRFDPISFQTFTSLFQLICSIFYMIFIIAMMIEGIQSFMKMKFAHFRNLRSLIDLGIIICSWANVGIYIWKCQESNRIGDLFKKTNGYVYISLQTAAYVNDLFIYLFGFCCFFGTIKFVHLFRFNRRSMYFIKTLQHASRSLISFAFMVSIIYAAFLTLFYFLFISKVEQCSSILQTIQMLFEMTLLKFDVHDLMEAASLLGPICFSLFIFIVVFICVSMFITIIRESFAFVRNEAKFKPNEDQHILSFMFSKLKQWLGLSKSSELERDEDMRSRYIDPIESFPDKINQLLDVLNQFHREQQLDQSRKEIKLSVDDTFN
ncbi:unnamed protein product, partial [Rotaria socialis]